MTIWLVILVEVLLTVAILVQYFYLRGFSKAGVEVSMPTKVITYANMALLVALDVGLLVYTFLRAGR